MAVNTSCAAAEELVGIAGTVVADNSVWAGVWPTGADPVFNWSHLSGGRPLWWKWTNPLDQPADLKVTPGVGKTIEGGIIFGTCGALVFDTTGAHSEFNAAFYTGSAPGDLIVQPGETVFIEIEAYPGAGPGPGDPETVEPPSSSMDIYGEFSFAWEAQAVTFTDEIPVSDLVVSPVASVVAGSGFPLSTILACEELGGRLFFAFEVDLGLYAGSCALDGSGLTVSHITGGSGVHWSGIGPDNVENRPCLVFDGVAVYLGFGISGFGSDPDNFCAFTPNLFCGGTHETFPPSTGIGYSYELYRYDVGSGTFGFFQSIVGSNGAVGPGHGKTQLLPFVTRMCASPNQRGRLFVYFAWAVKREEKSIRHSNYPTAAVVGVSNAGCDRCYSITQDVYTYAEVYRLTSAGGRASLMTSSSEVVNIRTLLSFDADANWFISPGSEVVYADGPWTTAPTGPYDSAYRRTVALVNDDGHPILISSPEQINVAGRIGGGTLEQLHAGAVAEGLLTSDGTAPADGATVTIGTRTYTFKTTLGVGTDQVLIGGSAAAALTNLKSAVNHSESAGVHFTSTSAHATVIATELSTTTLELVALAGGTGGNTIATTETSTHLSFGAATLTGGVDAAALGAAVVYGDLTGTADATALLITDELLAGPRYLNLETGEWERFLSIGWNRVGSSTNERWVHTVRSDLSQPPRFLIAGDASSSLPGVFLEGVYRDQTDGERNWYGHDQDDHIYAYDLCAGAWVVAFDAFLDGEAGTEWGVSNGAWVDNALYLLNQQNRIRKYPIERDTGVCTVTPLAFARSINGWMRVRH